MRTLTTLALWPKTLVDAGSIERLRWQCNRVRCMTPAEIGHRGMRSVALRLERLGLFHPAKLSPGRAPAPNPWLHQAVGIEAAPYVEAADKLASGKIDVFNISDIEVGRAPRWNRDVKTGIEAPLTFGKMLDCRDAHVVGDIRYIWELNRHVHLVTLAQAYALKGDKRYFNVLREHLESWFDSCPYGRGPNWASALEAALRLINWSLAWQLLGGFASPMFADAPGARLSRRWLQSIGQHAHFVRGYFSLYSSANNHLIGEAAGLFIAAVTWPDLPRSPEWLATARNILEREVVLQNGSDGVNREQAVSYQQFELDLMLLVLVAGRANGHTFSNAFLQRMESMLEFIASIMDCHGNVPAFGDSDDGVVVRLCHDPAFCRFRSLLATGAILFRRADFKAKAGDLDDKTRWLMGSHAEKIYSKLDASSAQLPVRRAFKEGGYYVLGCDFETENEIRAVVDTGPLGYQSIAAHGHADALSFTLSVGGQEFLVDPGTYTFQAQSEWRDYFRGTAAHNTARIDGQDQSQSGGNFMWLAKANASCSVWESTPELDLFEGSHDGYKRLPDPVRHWRRIALDKRTRRLVIEDTFEMAAPHLIELHFHCAAECSVEPALGGYSLRHGERSLILRLAQVPEAESKVYRGSLAPILGWVSSQFGSKQPASTIVWRGWFTKDVVLRSEIIC